MGYTDTSKTMLAARALAAFWAVVMIGAASAQPAAPAAQFGPQSKSAERSINEWLERMHQASGQRNYVGTLVVSSNTGAMSSARIWHACQGDQQVERIESLTGAPRSTFRRNEDVVTFLPEARV
ncbi:MAG TPA: sigma-E factor regulatory protein RseB domain-containing protein, partial [Ramlibacter sp.]|nr:sigma-E factor regulatory protein RseB domain-containing protein [Ramlibacter sp.]